MPELIIREREFQFGLSHSSLEMFKQLEGLSTEDARRRFGDLQKEYLSERKRAVQNLQFNAFVGRWLGLKIPQKNYPMPPFP